MMPSLLATIPLSILVGYATLQVGYQFPLSLPVFVYILPQVFILGIIIDSMMRFIYQLEDVKIKDKPGQTFINRLPHKLGDKLICFTMEDHYIQVYTELGNHMMLMRMKDALIELEDFDGMQVHRSYWVANKAVSGTRKESRKNILIMSNDMEVPVSRKYLSKAKEAGILYRD